MMTRQEFIKQYPTPQYTRDAWNKMHKEGLSEETMREWETSCRRARAEADAAYDEYIKNAE